MQVIILQDESLITMSCNNFLKLTLDETDQPAKHSTEPMSVVIIH